MKKFRIVMGAMALAVAAGAIIACNKEKTAQQETITDQQPIGTKDYTLAEMIEAMSWEDGKAFFENQPIKDYTLMCENIVSDCGFDAKTAGLPFIISWNLRTPNGTCNYNLSGACLVIRKKESISQEANATGFFEEGKLVIVADSEDNGFTSDGYLVIGSPIEIENDSIVIQEGVYAAYFDEELGTYTAVAVDYYISR